MPTNLLEAYKSPYDNYQRLLKQQQQQQQNEYFAQMQEVPILQQSPQYQQFQYQLQHGGYSQGQNNNGMTKETINNYSIKNQNQNQNQNQNNKEEIEGFSLDDDDYNREFLLYGASGLGVILLLDFIFTLGKYAK